MKFKGIKGVLLCIIAATLSVSSYGASECAPMPQPNGAVFDQDGILSVGSSDFSRLWECPSLQNVTLNDDGTYPFIHKLKNIDYSSGTYVCQYNYAQSGQYKQSCSFSSQLYRGMKNLTMITLKGRVKSDGTVVKGLFDKSDPIDLNQFNYLGVQYPPLMITAQNDFNAERAKLLKIQGGTIFDTANTNPRAVRNNVRAEYNENITNIENDLNKLQDIINRHLINPYLHPFESDIRKGYTLSNFVAGLVTLDPEVISGYNSNTGEILIRDEWKQRAAKIEVEVPSTVDGILNTIGDTISSAFNAIGDWIFGSDNTDTDLGEEQMETAKKIYGGDVQFEIYSYAKVFEEKLWGFYYLLQERFDIGYNILASNLLLLFGVGFLAIAGTQEGIKYLTAKENYEARMNETGYIKTLLVVLTLGFFFVSIPSGINDTPDESGNFQPNAMHKNYTIAKTVIRKSASYGANMATMFSDLGFSAFAQYIVKRQMLLSITEITTELQKSIEDIYMYPPALELRRECKIYYNAPSDAAFFDSIDDSNFPINEAWKDSDYAKKKNISALSYDLCKTAYKLYAMMPYQIGNAVVTAEERLKNADGKLSEATYLMTYNNIALGEKMGWVAAFGYPLEYFILKNNDMFLSKEVDGDKITEESEKYMNAILKDGDNMKRSSFGGDVQDNVSYGAAKAITFMNGYFIYNILPMFSDIQKGLYTYFEKVYESKYQVWLQNQKEEGESAASIFKKLVKKGKGAAYNMGAFGAMIAAYFKNPIQYSTLWHTGLLLLSYQLAIWVWRMTFAIVFTVLISMMFLISFIMYFFDLIVHFTTSLFMFVWAFGSAKTGNGESKIKDWLKNTLVIVFLKPSILIFGGFIFIFLYELMNTLYRIVFTSVTSNLMASISLMSTANKKTGVIDSISAYSTVMSMQAIADAVLPLFGLYFAYVAILKIPAIITKKVGADSDDMAHTQSLTEHVQSKQERQTNPAA